MQVTINQTTSFKAIHVQSSKMNKAQKVFSEKAVDILSYCDSYAEAANRNVDICISALKDDAVKVLFLDSKNETFFRNSKDGILSITSNVKEKTDLFIDKILKKLDNINNGKYKSKEFDCVAEYIENPKEFVNHKSEMNKYFDSFSFDDIDVNPLFIERYKKF